MGHKIALVGIGKIARDQHIPAINQSQDWQLAATVSRNASVKDVENFTTIEQLIRDRPDIDTVSLAIPAGPRFDYACKAIRAGKCVMLEKPPGASLAECVTLEALAREHQVALFASWHSREAEGVVQAKRWMAEHRLRRLHIVWKEDVRVWHPGQEWIWEPGGLGVFDPGINALSILSEILDVPVHLRSATLEIPSNRQNPIAAALQFSHPQGAEVVADFDWRLQGEPQWNIGLHSELDSMKLSFASSSMAKEYQGLYRRMASLRNEGAIDMDLSPLTHAADAFMMGRRLSVAPFNY